jgi:predicted transcriptional regulator
MEEGKKGTKRREELLKWFEDTLHDSILEGMQNVLGESCMRAALFHLQLVQYARNPREFHHSLETIFGQGAITIEKMIVKEMCRKLDLPYQEMEPFDFAKYCEITKYILTTSKVKIEDKGSGLSMSEPKELIKRLLASEVKGDLLVLFHKNPGLIDTIDGVARRIGRCDKDVEADVKDLVEIGVLNRKKLGQSEIVFLNQKRDKEIQTVITKYLTQLKRS